MVRLRRTARGVASLELKSSETESHRLSAHRAAEPLSRYRLSAHRAAEAAALMSNSRYIKPDDVAETRSLTLAVLFQLAPTCGRLRAGDED